MNNWKVYILTFVTYALIHSVRTSWSYIKTFSQGDPLDFSTQFLGELDMIILICLAVSLKTLGWIGEKIGHKNFLLIGMSYLTMTFLLIGILQIVGINQHWVYILLYAMLGIASCTGWPSCLSVQTM
jgi:sugar phosphate permease